MTNFYAFITESSRTNGDALAIRWPRVIGPADVTFDELNHRVDIVRHQLFSQGVRAGDVCLLAIPVSLPAVVATLALMAGGAVPLLPPAGMSVAQWRRIRRKYRIKAIVTDPHPPFKLRLLSFLSRTKLITINVTPESSAKQAPAAVAGTQAGLITFSSGSTGRPKAIERSHAVLTAQHQAILHHFPAPAGMLDFPLFPNVLLHNLAAGVGTVLPDIPGFQLDQLRPEKIITQIQQEGPQTLTGNVFYFTRLLEYAEAQARQLPKVEAVGVGGSPVSERLLLRLQKLFCAARLYVIYGASEAEPIAVREFTAPEDPLRGYAVGPIHPGLRWKLVATDAPPGKEIGELWVTGPHVVLSKDQTWFATGDVGYVRDNKLFLTARRGNEAVIGGKQHYQLEHYLHHQEGINKAAAVVNGRTFDVFFEGITTISAVRASLSQVIDLRWIKTIRRMDTLPVDRRHRSKILYHQLKP